MLRTVQLMQHSTALRVMSELEEEFIVPRILDLSFLNVPVYCPKLKHSLHKLKSQIRN